MIHEFKGSWITDEEFYELKPINPFGRELEEQQSDNEAHPDRHILFRKKLHLDKKPKKATVYISADDYFKLYVNGKFVSQGPAPAYHSNYRYNTLDVAPFLDEGENTIAVHTLYQGLINRVWQSGDNRHGLILDLECDEKTVLVSDESFLTCRHSGFTPLHTVGYKTQFMEEYDSRAREIGFEMPDFDDSYWKPSQKVKYNDRTLVPQETYSLVFENISPVLTEKRGNTLFIDFGKCFVGYLGCSAKGKSGDKINLRFGQELNDDGTVRFTLRAYCKYSESWILSGENDTLNQFDFKAFRYCELDIPDGAEISDIHLIARHYPFNGAVPIKKEYAGNANSEKIYELCVNTLKYGIQEVIQDCCDREKGFYMGDGCYTALTHLTLTGDDTIVRKLIDDGFYSSFITEGLVTCLDCSFMQEIGEFPLMLVHLVLWHYRITGDREYLKINYSKCVHLLDCYRDSYAREDGLLCNLDKWCVVEWPDNFRDGYDVDITAGKICTVCHTVMNAHYLESISTVNKMSAVLGVSPYKNDLDDLKAVFFDRFYDRDNHRYFDSDETKHSSLISNLFCFGYMLSPDAEFEENTLCLLRERKISSVSMFCAFVAMEGLVRRELWTELRKLCIEDENAWLKMLREDATTTFESWGKDLKWNTSLCHLTLSYAAFFLCDADIKRILE